MTTILARRGRLVPLAAVVLVALAAPNARAQAPSSPPPTLAPQLPEHLQRYFEVSRPGTEHKRLDAFVGRWSFQGRWMGVDGKTVSLEGTSENRWVMGGRFLMCEASAEVSGEKVETLTVLGFDQRQQRYFALALDSIASYYIPSSGTYEAATRSFVLSGKERDEITGIANAYRLVLRIEGTDRYTVEVFLDAHTGPLRVVSFAFVRKSEAAAAGGDARPR
jgi:hypothetical protein